MRQHFEGVPGKVRKAIRQGDAEAIRAMAASGGRASARKRAERADVKEAFALLDERRKAKDEADRQKAAGEDIIPLETYE